MSLTSSRSSTCSSATVSAARRAPATVDGDGDTDLADLGILLADFGCTPPPNCVGDLDGDGDTDLADLGILLADFGCTAGPGNCPGDIDCDGDTDLADLGILLANFGRTCP